MRTLHEPVAILHCQGCFRGMDENHVVVDDLEFHDTNGGQHALWNISPPNSRWVSCSFDEVHADVEIGVDEWTDGALVVENTIYFVHQLYVSLVATMDRSSEPPAHAAGHPHPSGTGR